MTRYKNLGNNSNVYSYETGSDYIKVKFNGGATYLYNYLKTGKLSVEKMKELARLGRGLNSYINRFVRKLYAEKCSY